jgi:hypothetical protein
MNRITARYAEQQIARLAREYGVKMHYTHQGKTDDQAPVTLAARGLAQPATYGTKDAWVLDASAANGWLGLYAYAEEGLGGLYSPLGHHTHKAAEWWELAGFALDSLRFDRELVKSGLRSGLAAIERGNK